MRKNNAVGADGSGKFEDVEGPAHDAVYVSAGIVSAHSRRHAAGKVDYGPDISLRQLLEGLLTRQVDRVVWDAVVGEETIVGGATPDSNDVVPPRLQMQRGVGTDRACRSE